MSGFGFGSDGSPLTALNLTSDVKVGRSRVPRSCAVHRHALILALVGFLAVLDL